MPPPRLLRLRRRHNPPAPAVPHIGNGLRHPLHQRLRRPHKVAHRCRIHREQVRIARAGHPHIGARPVGELLLQYLPAHALNVYLVQRAGHRVIARGENDDIQLKLPPVLQPQTRRRDPRNRRRAHIHQRHIRPVVHLIVPALAGQPLGTKHMVLRRQQLRHLRIVNPLPDFVADELRIILIRRAGHHHIVKIGQPLLEPRLRPQPLVLRPLLLLRHLQR